MHKWIKVTDNGIMHRVVVAEEELEKVMAALKRKHPSAEIVADTDYVYPGVDEVQKKCQELAKFLNEAGHGIILLTDSPLEDAVPGKDRRDDGMTFHAAIAGDRRFLFHGHKVLTMQLQKMAAKDFFDSVLAAFDDTVMN